MITSNMFADDLAMPESVETASEFVAYFKVQTIKPDFIYKAIGFLHFICHFIGFSPYCTSVNLRMFHQTQTLCMTCKRNCEINALAEVPTSLMVEAGSMILAQNLPCSPIWQAI